jgi:glucose-6-phosphate 1-dehydrogenase
MSALTNLSTPSDAWLPHSAARHPFLTDLSKHRGALPTVIVIFGASGDLTARKLMPAVYNLGVDNLLPPCFYLIGYGRKPMSHEAFYEAFVQSAQKHSRRQPDAHVLARFQANLFYQGGDYDDPQAYQQLYERIQQLEAQLGQPLQSLFYISTPPDVFKTILNNLGKCRLASRHLHTPAASKVILEKPFGKDLASAQELNAVISEQFQEDQVYRIDHYLGKETVQDLLVQRFTNSIFEPLWNFHYVDCVQITVAEDLGVGSRGGYYDKSGALRDMIQNHTMQLLSLVAMEPPVSSSPEDIRNEKVKLLKAIQPPQFHPQGCDVVRAQYTEGLINGQRVPGYLSEDHIDPQSSTETYAALRLFINNWRWKGVPFYLRSGKRMARRVTEIAIQFKKSPGTLFKSDAFAHLPGNALVIQIQPDEGTSLILNSKVPGLETRLQPIKMHFRYATTYGSNTPEAYERLILDCMIGDSTLFIRGDEAMASWSICTPVLEFWKACGRNDLPTYSAGSWGPLESDKLLWQHDHQWRRIGP